MRKFYRQDEKLAGVCGGIGHYLCIDPVIIRMLFVLLFFTPTPICITYFIIWLLSDEKPKSFNYYNDIDIEDAIIIEENIED